MTFDDEMRNRFTDQTPTVSDLDGGAASAAKSADRRSAVLRGAGAIVVIAAVAMGAVAFANRASTPNDVATDTDAVDADDPDVDAPDNSINAEPDPLIEPIDTSQTVGLVTVDVDGVLRLNGDVLSGFDALEREGYASEDIQISAVDGVDGSLVIETNAGVFTDGALVHKAPDAILHDVTADTGPLISWDIPAGNDPSGPVFGGWSDENEWPDLLPVDAEPIAASFGPGGHLLLSIEGVDCNRLFIVDRSGGLVEGYGINERSACFPGEIGEWSTSGDIVLVRPTEQDSWGLTIIGQDSSANVVIPGAFQPLALDVHTGPDGTTEAVILGTGEELVYVDVDRFLTADDPMVAVLGISNEQNLVSARLVSGFPPHPYRPIESASDALEPEPPTEEPQPELEPAEPTDPPIGASVWSVTNVDSDDTLNARSGAGTSFDVVFEFAPNATGVVRTQSDPQQIDGGEWVEVFAPTSGTEFDIGWVNSAFLQETDASDTRPCMFNGPQDHYIGIDWTNDDGEDSSDAAVVSNIDTYRFGGCLRTVIEFSSGWSYEDNIVRSTTLPSDIVVSREPVPTIDFGSSITGAEVAEARFLESTGVSHSTFLSLGSGFTLEGLLYGPTSMTDVAYDNANGRIIIDTADVRLPDDADNALRERVGGGSPIVDRNGLVLSDVSPTADDQSFTFVGLARPFEASLGVDVVTTGGAPVEVSWIGGVIDDVTSQNGVMTSTWTEAWGQFSFTIELPAGIDPVDVLVRLDPSGGAIDNPTTIDIPLGDFVS